MKRILTSLSILFLAVLVLLGSGGFAVGRMVCVGNGHVSYSIGNAKDCCEKNGASHKTLKKPCCDLKTISYSLDDFNSSQKVKLSSEQFAICSLPNILPSHLPSALLHLTSEYLPPPDGKDRLHLIGALLL